MKKIAMFLCLICVFSANFASARNTRDSRRKARESQDFISNSAKGSRTYYKKPVTTRTYKATPKKTLPKITTINPIPKFKPDMDSNLETVAIGPVIPVGPAFPTKSVEAPKKETAIVAQPIMHTSPAPKEVKKVEKAPEIEMPTAPIVAPVAPTAPKKKEPAKSEKTEIKGIIIPPAIPTIALPTNEEMENAKVDEQKKVEEVVQKTKEKETLKSVEIVALPPAPVIKKKAEIIAIPAPQPIIKPEPEEDLPWETEATNEYAPKLDWKEPEEKQVAMAKPPKKIAPPLPDSKKIEDELKNYPSIPETPTLSDENGRKLLLRVRFAESQTTLSPFVEEKITKLVKSVKENEHQILIVRAYADGDDENSGIARRVSLSRAVEVRKFLISEGFDKTRIIVRAMGNEFKEPPADRVDILLDEK